MKTTLISDGDSVNIVLTPENEFEKDIIEKVYDCNVFSLSKDKYKTETEFYYSGNSYSKTKHQINLVITKIREAQG